MNTVSKAHFAQMCSVSKAAITKACKAGSLGTEGEGRKQVINLDHRLTKEYLKDKAGSAPKKEQSKKSAADPFEITAPESDEHGLPAIRSLDDINESNLFLLEKKDIDKLKAYEQALETRLKREERRGILISRDTVKLVFSKIYTVDNNELKTMEERLTPAICGIFGEEDDSGKTVLVRKLLNDEITKSLRHIKRIVNDFLVRQGSDKI